MKPGITLQAYTSLPSVRTTKKLKATATRSVPFIILDDFCSSVSKIYLVYELVRDFIFFFSARQRRNPSLSLSLCAAGALLENRWIQPERWIRTMEARE